MLTQTMERPVGTLRGGDHVCLPYSSHAEHMTVLAGYFRGGERMNQQLYYFADERPIDEVIHGLELIGVPAEQWVGDGSLVVGSSGESYLANGSFDPDRTIEGWFTAINQAIVDGYAGIRVAGDMAWLMREIRGVEFASEYERRIEKEVFSTGRVTGMCELDRTRLSPEVLSAQVALHEKVALADPLLRTPSIRASALFSPVGARLTGDLDFTVAPLVTEMINNLSRIAPDEIVLDVDAVEVIDLGTIEAIRRAAAALRDGKYLHLVNVSPQLQRIFEFGRLNTAQNVVISRFEG